MNDTVFAKIDAGEKNISNIFCDSYNFSIPPYQRPYAWEREQASELLQDLMDAAGVSPSNDETYSAGMYFLGSLVLVKKQNAREARIVDGQQRLITLTILLCVLRDITVDESQKRELDRYVRQAAQRFLGLPEQLRIRLRRQEDQSFFEEHIQSIDATANLPPPEQYEGSQTLIIENADYFRDQVGELTENNLTRLIVFILNSCYVVVITVPIETAARRIFKVLNARGLDLYPTDLLKVDLLERAVQRGGEDLERELSEQWENAESALGRDRFIDLFTHIRFIYQREKPRLALEEGFPKYVEPFTKFPPRKFFDNVFKPYEKALALLDDDPALFNKLGAKVAARISALKRLDNKDWEAPLIFCLNKFLKGEQFNLEEFVIKYERLAYYLFVTRADVNIRSRRYGSVLDQIDPRARMPQRHTDIELSDEETKTFFDALDGPVYLSTRVVRPLLLRLDQALSDQGAVYHQPIITVEHVAPQTIQEKSQWDIWFANRDVHEFWLHRIANLVLLSRRKNSKASNFDFEQKKTEYFVKDDVCPFILTAQVLQVDEWSENLLSVRQLELIAALAKDWELVSEFEQWKAKKLDQQDQYNN